MKKLHFALLGVLLLAVLSLLVSCDPFASSLDGTSWVYEPNTTTSSVKSYTLEFTSDTEWNSTFVYEAFGSDIVTYANGTYTWDSASRTGVLTVEDSSNGSTFEISEDNSELSYSAYVFELQ